MAGDWIAMRLDLYEDPAVAYMAERLGEREETIVGFLHRVWAWASRQCHDGTVTNVTLASLGRVTSLPNFPDLMVEAGWLEHGILENGKPYVRFPNWDRWMAESAKKRLLAAKRQAKKRHADVTDLSRSERDESVTTGEESREEKSKKKEIPPLSPQGEKQVDEASQVVVVVEGEQPEPEPQKPPEETLDKPPQNPPAVIETPPEFPEEVRDVCEAWLEYKRQRGHKYKQMGLKKLVTQVENGLRTQGAAAVRAALEHAMANNYQGWTFCVGKSGGGGQSRPITFGQQRQQNLVDMFARLKAQDDAASGGFTGLIGQQTGEVQ